MLIVREVFTAKPGQASRLAKLLKKMTANDPGSRILTDFIGHYNTVVMEMQAENMAAWEEQFNAYRSGKAQMDPALAEEMSHYHDLYVTGSREVFQVVE